MQKINVLVTGVGGGIGEQVIKCLKLSSLNYFIVGSDTNTINAGFSEVDRAYVVPRASDTTYIDTLIDICRKNKIQALFPGSEPELFAISNNRELFASLGVLVFINPRHVIDICLDKNMTMDWFAKNNINYPKSYRITPAFDLSSITDFPVVVKPSKNGGGSVNVFIARDIGELSLFAGYLLKIYNEFIAQEYIGSCYEEYTVGVLFDLDGNYLNSIAVKKDILANISNRIKIPNTTEKTDLGDFLAISNGISQGQIGKFPNITEPCIKIAKKLGCRCSINIQCRYHNGKIFVFEINPRISGTSPLRAMVGFNEPEILIRKHILNEVIAPDFKFNEGNILRYIAERFVSDNMSISSRIGSGKNV